MQFEAQKPNRAAAGVFKILAEAVCGATAADGVQDYIVSSPHATHLMQYYVFSSGTCSMGGMARVVYDVKIFGVCMQPVCSML